MIEPYSQRRQDKPITFMATLRAPHSKTTKAHFPCRGRTFASSLDQAAREVDGVAKVGDLLELTQQKSGTFRTFTLFAGEGDLPAAWVEVYQTGDAAEWHIKETSKP